MREEAHCVAAAAGLSMMPQDRWSNSEDGVGRRGFLARE